MEHIENAKRIVIKVGSSLIVNPETGVLRQKWLKSLIDDVAKLKKQGKDVIIVTSGAVALGRKHISKKRKLKLEQKQASAACGQSELIQNYQKYLKSHKYTAAQILLTIFDSENRRNYLNARNTLNTLLEAGIIPVINENDTVATHEIRFGDNDRLAARVAQMVSADVLVLFSDVDGFYTANPQIESNAKLIPEVHEVDSHIMSMAGEALSEGVGSGGMITKIEAAKIATESGCHMILTLGTPVNPVQKLLKGGKHTLFIADESPIKARKNWIASSLVVSGSLIIDNGAVEALKKGKSLLPAGVVDVKGDFDRGDTVVIKNVKLQRIGVGLTAYSSQDAMMIMGQQSKEIKNIIGFSGRKELIHRDDMVMDK